MGKSGVNTNLLLMQGFNISSGALHLRILNASNGELLDTITGFGKFIKLPGSSYAEFYASDGNLLHIYQYQGIASTTSSSTSSTSSSLTSSTASSSTSSTSSSSTNSVTTSPIISSTKSVVSHTSGFEFQSVFLAMNILIILLVVKRKRR